MVLPCHGYGPDRDVAIRLAINQCRSLAVNQLNTSFTVNSLSVETERSVGFHEEVTSNEQVSGLDCEIKDQYEAKTDTGVDAWVLCKMSVSKAKIAPVKNFSADVQNEASDRHIDKKEIVQSRNKQLIVSSVPHCETILIRGKLTKLVRCDSNPQTVMVEPSDKEIIIRASGYRPKHVRISGDRESATETEIVDAYLDR